MGSLFQILYCFLSVALFFPLCLLLPELLQGSLFQDLFCKIYSCSHFSKQTCEIEWGFFVSFFVVFFFPLSLDLRSPRCQKPNNKHCQISAGGRSWWPCALCLERLVLQFQVPAAEVLAGLLKCCAAPLHMIKARGFRFLKKKKKIKKLFHFRL